MRLGVCAEPGSRCVRLAIASTLLLALGACKSDVEKIAEHTAKAELLLEASNHEEALAELRDALRLNPQDAELNFRIGDVLERESRFEDAIFFYSEAQRLDPRRTDAALREAALLIFDDPQRAKQMAAEVLEREPDSFQAYVILSRRALVERDVAEALRLALTAVELNGSAASAHLHLGKVRQAQIVELAQQEEALDDASFEATLRSLDRAIELGGAVSSPDRAVELRAKFSATQARLERARVLSIWNGHEAEAAEAFRVAVEDALASGREALWQDALQKCRQFATSSGNSELLRWTFEKRVAADPTNLEAWSRLARIRQSMDGSGNEVLQRLLEVQPEVPQAHVLYARSLAAANRADEAFHHLEQVANQGVEPAVILGELLKMLYAGHQTDRAEAIAARLAREYPEHPVTVLAFARRALADRRVADAASALQSLVGSTESFEAYFLLAEVEQRRGNAPAALDAVRRAIEFARGGAFPAAAVRLRSRIQAELGSCDSALRDVAALSNNGIALGRGDRILQAKCLYEIGRPVVGRSVLEKLLKRRNPDLMAILEFADREMERDPKRVREVLEASLARHPHLAPVLLRAARLDLRDGQAQRALDRLNRAIESGGGSAPILMERSRVLAAQGRLDDAQRDALRAFEANPGLPGVSSLLLSLYRAQGKTDEVIASFEEAASAGALKPPARVLLAKLHLQVGNEARAREIQEALLAEGLDLPAVKNDLAYLLAREGGDLDRALELAQDAQRSFARVPAAADTLGYVYLKRGLYEPALEQFRYAVSLAEPGPAAILPALRLHEGMALRALGRSEEAASAFEQALALDSNFEEAAEALRDLRSAAKNEPPPANSS